MAEEIKDGMVLEAERAIEAAQEAIDAARKREPDDDEPDDAEADEDDGEEKKQEEEAASQLNRQKESITEAEIDAFDRAARQRFESEIRRRYAGEPEISPGTVEAEREVRRAIRGN